MQIDLSNLALPLSLLFSPLKRQEDILQVQVETQSQSAQQPIQVMDSMGNVLTVNHVNSVLFPLENQSSDSQPMEQESKELMTYCVYYCKECNGTNIEISAWIDPNDGDAVLDSEGPLDMGWCRDCQDNCVWDILDIEAESMDQAIEMVPSVLAGEDND